MLEPKNNNLKNNDNIKENNDKGFVNCPYCSVSVVFEGGCYLITCPSANCNNKNFFCYLCGHKISYDRQYQHFPNGKYELCIKKNKNNSYK
jgi:hypothetical protein